MRTTWRGLRIHNARDATSRRRLFIAAAVLLLVCGAAFLVDALIEVSNTPHFVAELVAVVALWTGTIVGLYGYLRTEQHTQAVEDQLEMASGAFKAVLDRHFEEWKLTPAECDVALLSIKGLPNAKIAELRQTREGTVKAQNAAVYRKAGVSSRAELLSLFIEEIVAGIPDDRLRD